MEGSVLVIGGGIAGIQTSLDLTELGFKVYLVERGPSIGGRMAQLDKLYPKNKCSLCVLAPKMVAVYKDPNITLFTLSEVQTVSGKAGNFTVTINKNPRYIDETKCRGCGDCAANCPKIEVPNEFDMNLGKRRSIYIPFPQATPPVYLIDPSLCLYLNRNICGVCQKVCKAGAIDFEQKSESIKLHVGAIVVATGFDMLSEELSQKWGYNYKNVINALEYERILCPTGPFGNQILRPGDEKEPKNIAFIQCVGLDYFENSSQYCSRDCCMYTTKNSILTKTLIEDAQVSVFRNKLRVFGKNFYDYIKEAQDRHGVAIFQNKIEYISGDPETNDVIIHYKDLETGKDIQHNVDMVVLSAPLIPSKGTRSLAKILAIELDRYNFFKSDSHFNKTQSTREGIFLAGFCQSPMNIAESVSSASGVAGQVSVLLNSVRHTQTTKREYTLPKEEIVSMTPRALIIGGGISGMTSALNIGNQGFEAVLVEKENELGGNLRNINVLYPSQEKASDFLKNIKEKIRKHNNVKLFLNSKIKGIEGSIGNYNITIEDENDKAFETQVGTIIIATGGKEFKPHGLFQYQKKNQNVITQLELEKRLKGGDYSWLENINHISVILCVNARQKDGFSYCSNVCCSTAIKNIKILKTLKSNLKILVLFRDLHMAKKEFEDIFSERKELANYIRYDLTNIPKIEKIRENPEKYQVKLHGDLHPKEFIEFNSDLIVLSTPIIPPDGLKELSQIINAPLNENGFFFEAHTELRPLDFSTHGIFACGCVQWPKNIQDSIAEANGAACRASRFLSLKEISSTKLEFLSFMLSIQCFFKDMLVNEEKCNGCGRCKDVCAFKAITLNEIKQEFEDVSLSAIKAFINPAICKGCGKCAATCRTKAIESRHYDFKQISSIIDPYFLERAVSGETFEDKKEIAIFE